MQTQKTANQVPQQTQSLSPSSPNTYSAPNPNDQRPVASYQRSPNSHSPMSQSSQFQSTQDSKNNTENTGISGSDYQSGWSVPTVEDELNKLTSSDSLTMQQARNAGLRTAGSRGLLNSSIAGQASEQAAIQAAMPMAQQNVQNQLQQQQFAQGITANTQGQYMQATNDILNQALISINEIETAQGIEQAEKDKMIANTIKRRDEDLKFMKNYYSMMPTWSGNWVNFPVMPSAPGVS